MKPILLLISLLLSLAATRAPVDQEHRRKATPPESVEPMRTGEQTIQAHAGYSLFGPITYDQLGTYNKTGSAKRDPQLRSYYLGLAAERPLAVGGYYFKAFTRQFQKVRNGERGTYTNDDVGLIRQTNVAAKSIGVGAGWEFRSSRRFIKWIPFLGVAFERNTVEVSGRNFDETENIDDPIHFQSVLTGVYAETGTAYRFFIAPFEPALLILATIPLHSSVTNSASNPSEEAITSRLYHGMRFSLSLGLSLSYWID